MKKTLMTGMVVLASLFSGTAFAKQSVTLTTAKMAGETLTFEVNATSEGVDVDWGDGNVVNYPRTDASKILIEGTIQSTGTTSVVKITFNDFVNYFKCDGQQLSKIDIKNANNIETLIIPNNLFTVGANLSFANETNLKNLDISGAALTSLNFTAAKYPKLEILDLSNNAIKTAALALPKLTEVNYSNCTLTSFTITSSPNIETLNLNGNKITKLNLASNLKLTTVMVSDNELTSIIATTDSTGLPELKTFIADNNMIETLNLSYSPKLQFLSLSGNNCRFVSLPMDENGRLTVFEDKIITINYDGNSLPSMAVPNQKATFPEYFSADGNVYDITDKLKEETDGTHSFAKCPSTDASDRNNPEYLLDISSVFKSTFFKHDVWTIENGVERKLVAGATGDYQTSSGKYNFYKDFDEVFIRMPFYANANLWFDTTHFSVGEGHMPTGIKGISASLPIKNGTAYDLTGRSTNITAKGIMIINGKKVLVK